MADLSDFNIPASLDAPLEQAIGDIYFKATSIGSDPVGFGSDEFFEVADNQTVGGGGSAAVFAHEVIASAADKIKVRYGHVANIDTSGTDPDISLATEYTVQDGSRIFIQVTVDSSNGQPTAAQIYVNTVVPSDSTTVAYLQLAQVTVSSGSITNIAQTASGSFDMLSCASVHLFCRL
jgi:hypothetical protein